jgi:RNA polymerase sigma factor (sigma-70 family)
MNKTDLQVLGDESQKVWEKFYELVQPYRSALWRYCLKLTGTPWDAEDLIQDTLLKSFASLSALSHREQPLKTKSYLFRVATNHWLDQCRKNKHTVLDDRIDEESTGEELKDRLEVTEALETLIHHLPPRQAIVFILMESFRFTAKEVGELIATTEGAVHAMLHRARRNLNLLQEENIKSKKITRNSVDNEAMEKFLTAYNRKDFRGLANLLIDEATFSFVQMNSTEYGKDTIIKYSLNPNKGSKFEDIHVHATELWSKSAIVFILTTKQGPMLFDVNTIEWHNDKIARWNCYYFCREFMQHAAEQLNLPLAPIIEQ